MIDQIHFVKLIDLRKYQIIRAILIIILIKSFMLLFDNRVKMIKTDWCN